MPPQITPVPTKTRQLIEDRLASIASEQNIKILYACESGSQAWGFPSPDSDYDVRIIYAHPVDWYLKLDEDRDVIDLPLESTSAGLLDLGGWDLRKTLRLLGKSNPVIWEWLQSPICYLDDKILRESRDVFDPFFSPITACHHYLSICRNTMNQGLNGSTVKIKKYFYMLRPLLAAAWIERFHAIPPMELSLLLPLLDDRAEIKESILELQERKQNIDEQVPIARIAMIDNFLVSEVARLQDTGKLLPVGNGDKTELDSLFRKCLDL
ncbi:nucleotidyltransferase domain-containing protein [Methylomonas sp. YC3]